MGFLAVIGRATPSAAAGTSQASPAGGLTPAQRQRLEWVRALREVRPVGAFRWAFLWLLPWILLPVALLSGWAAATWAAPGLCVGPVCGQEITRSRTHPWQLRLRLEDQRGHRERIVVDCRDGTISPFAGTVERGFAGAVARRACRSAGEA
jgi:hypothetical protein